MTHGRMGAPDARRFAVYRNNVAVGLIGALEARYPVSRRIAGDDLFRAMARAFVRANKPRSPVMIAYGGEFPEFVAEYLARGPREVRARLLPPCGGGTRRGVAPSNATREQRAIRQSPGPARPPTHRAFGRTPVPWTGYARPHKRGRVR